LTEQLEKGLQSTYANALGRLKYGANQFPLENEGKIMIPIERMQILVRFYFPELEKNFDRIKKVWEEAGDGVARSIAVERLRSQEIEKARALLSRCVYALHAAIGDFVESMCKIARELMRE